MQISLVGLPGVGKSTIGRQLAKHRDVPFLDCDAAVEDRVQTAIAVFFERHGEAAFRDVEAQTLDALTSAGDGIVATGGGVVTREDNRRVLRERTFCVYLHAEPERLIHRLRRNSKRPLLQVADPLGRLHELYRERDPLYREVAALVLVTAGRRSEQLVEAIERACPHHPQHAAESGHERG